MHLISKKIYLLQKYKNSECTDTFQIPKIYIFEKINKYFTVTRGNKRSGVETCIVIRIITVQANTYTYFKTTYEFCFNV